MKIGRGNSVGAWLVLAGAVTGLTGMAGTAVYAQQAEQVFIEGFPDVPLLEGMEEQAGERLVFDAPSGTVAETVIRANKPGKAIMDAYARELTVFGWACVPQPMALRCQREKNALIFLDKAPTKKSGIIILRLLPLE
ncbi:MAG: hypothetical protein KUG56_05590 [Kordiimonadaceae bacterium]|nr:hypothetical protein [Kordiimonadaceae bacterium]